MPVASLILCCFLLAQGPSFGQPPGASTDPAPPTAIPESDRGAVAAPPWSHRGNTLRTPPRTPVSAPSPSVEEPAREPASTPAIPPAQAQEPAVAASATTAEPPAVVTPSTSRRVQPPDMVAAILKLPEGSKVTGRPLSLLDALSKAPDRNQRLAVTHAYWRLTYALAEYNLCYREHEQLRDLRSAPHERRLEHTAQSSAEAAVQAAEVALTTAQYELAEAAGLSSQDALPLPADAPHVGPYRTSFDLLAARQSLPPRLRLLDRTMPVRRKAIDVWAAAVIAAQDALETVTEARRPGGGTDLTTVLEYQSLLGRRQRSLMAAVCDYNHDIADYAITVAGPEVNGSTLVSMLIKSSQPASSRSAPGGSGAQPKASLRNGEALVTPDPDVQPAGLNEPIPDPATQLQLPPPPTAQPTPALPRTQVAPRPGQPTLAPPRPRTSGVFQQTAHRLALSDAAGAGLYPGLVDVKPGVRAQRLADALFESRLKLPDAGKAVELKDCLREARGGNRSELLMAYWRARQTTADYQVLKMHADWLTELGPSILERHDQPAGPGEMLRLRAAQLAVEASLLEAQVRMLDAQFELTRHAGLPLESTWLLAATAPHTGPYQLRFEAQPPQVVASWPVRRLAATIPALADNLKDRSAAVVHADTDRADALGDFQAGRCPLNRLLDAINRQTTETRTFLETVTEYNNAIAAYVLAVAPPTLPAEKLAETLVVTKRGS